MWKGGLLVTAFAFFAAAPAHAQVGATVSGRITLQSSGDPVEAAWVEIEGHPGGVASDSLGRYRLESVPPGPQTLRVERLGLATVRTNITVPTRGVLPVDVLMTERALELEGVTVTADVSGRARGELTTASVIESEAIQNQTAASLQGVLELTPGVPLSPPGLDQIQQISLRAAPTSQGSGFGGPSAADVTSFGTLIVLDGVPLSNNANLQTTGPRGEFGPPSTSGGGIDLRRIPASLLERVEVIRGLPSVRYGDLTQGAIVVDTRAGEAPLELAARFDPNSGAVSTLGGRRLGPKQAASASFDVTRTLLQPGRREDDAYRFALQLAHRASIGGPPGSDTERIRLDTRVDAFQVVEDNPEDPDVARGASSRARDTGVRVLERAFMRLSPSSSLNLTAAFDYARQTAFAERLAVRPAMPFARTFEEGRAEGKYLGGTYVARTDLDGSPALLYTRLEGQLERRYLGMSHEIRLGGELRREWNSGSGLQFDIEFPPQTSFNGVQGFDRPRTFDEVPAVASSSLYLDDRAVIALGERGSASVQAGLRLDVLNRGEWWWDEVRDMVLQPRLSAEVAPVPWLRFRGSAGRTTKSPALADLSPAPQYYDVVNVNWYSVSPEERLAVLTTFIEDPANPDLGFSTATNLEAGLEVLVGSRSSVALVYFDDRTAGAVGIRPEPGFLVREHYQLTDSIEGNGIRPDILLPAYAADTVPILIQQPANNLDVRSRGWELMAYLPEIAPIRTRIELMGSRIETGLSRDGIDLGNRFSEFQMNGRVPRIPYWEAVTTAGRETLLTSRIVHHQPRLGLVLTATVQHVLEREREDFGAADSLSWAGYLNRAGELVPVPEQDRARPEYEDLQVTRGASLDHWTSPSDWIMSLQVSKTLPLDGRLSFYAFNALDRRGTVGTVEQLPILFPTLRFGIELRVAPAALGRVFD